MFETVIYYQTDAGIEELSKTTTDCQHLLPDGSVESSGEFSGSGGDTISWTANSSIPPGEARMETQYIFDCPGCDENFDGLLRIHSYFDEDVGDSPGDCVLIVRGSAATGDLELFTVDLENEYGVSHAGGFGTSLSGATFDGWAADKFADLRNPMIFHDIAPTVSPTGIIDLTDLPVGSSPELGDFFGPRDITTVMSYTLDDGVPVAPLSFNLFTPAYAAGMASITFGLGGVPSTDILLESPRALKQVAIDDLQMLQSSLNKKGQEKMAEALEYLNESIFGEPGDDEQLWVDDFHLFPDNGDDVFGTQNDAAEKLMEIIEKPDEFGASGIVDDIIDIIENKILHADRVLAQTAIDEAVGGDSDLIEEANEEMDKAADEIANGEYDKAKENYHKAWESALKAAGII